MLSLFFTVLKRRILLYCFVKVSKILNKLSWFMSVFIYFISLWLLQKVCCNSAKCKCYNNYWKRTVFSKCNCSVDNCREIIYLKIIEFNFCTMLSYTLIKYTTGGRTFERLSEAVTKGVLYEKMFLKNSQNSQENTCVGVSFLLKLRA